MNWRKSLYVCLVSLFVLCILSGSLIAAAKATATVVEAVGKAEISYIGGVWVPLKVGTKLYENDTVRTGPKSKIRIKFADKTFTSIGENSNVRLDKFSSKSEIQKTLFKKKKITARKINLKILKGNAFSKLSKLQGSSSFAVSTPTAVCGVRGTSFEVAHADETDIAVLDGEVEAYNPEFPEQRVRVGKGSGSRIGKKAPPSKPKPLPPSKLKQLKKQEKVIYKKVKIPLLPEEVDQSWKVVKETDAGKTIEYTYKIKNILVEKTTVSLVLFNEKMEFYKAIPMQFSSGAKDIAAVKTYKVQYTFTETGKFSHRFGVKVK